MGKVFVFFVARVFCVHDPWCLRLIDFSSGASGAIPHLDARLIEDHTSLQDGGLWSVGRGGWVVRGGVGRLCWSCVVTFCVRGWVCCHKCWLLEDRACWLLLKLLSYWKDRWCADLSLWASWVVH